MSYSLACVLHLRERSRSTPLSVPHGALAEPAELPQPEQDCKVAEGKEPDTETERDRVPSTPLTNDSTKDACECSADESYETTGKTGDAS